MVVMATGAPKMEEGRRRPCSRVAMATQIREASFEDKTHMLPTYNEVSRTPQDSLQSRGPSVMDHVLLVPPWISQTFRNRRASTFLWEEGWGLATN